MALLAKRITLIGAMLLSAALPLLGSGTPANAATPQCNPVVQNCPPQTYKQQ